MSNSILVLTPYLFNGIWVFDDPRTDLVREAFVAGIPEIFDALHKEHQIKNPKDGFNLLFSETPFPGYQLKADWLEEGTAEFGGNWYRAILPDGKVQDGWLCPALYKYFSVAPKVLYIRVESLPEGMVLQKSKSVV